MSSTEPRARIADGELVYYEEIIAQALEVINQLKPVIHRIKSDDLDGVLQALLAANFIRQRTIQEMNRRKGEAAENRRNGKERAE